MALATLLACSDLIEETAITPKAALPIAISGSIVQQNVTRANDFGFVTGDRMGIYVVDYNDDGTPGTLQASNNRTNNAAFTFDGDSYTWSSPTTIYWRDQQTPIDVYGYYPQVNAILDPRAWLFSVQADQSIEARDGSLSTYEQSDLLWGKAAGVQFTQEAIVVKYRHILAGVRVHLTKGTGINDTEWEKLEKIVMVDHTTRQATIDLATGLTSPSSSQGVEPIRMAQQGNSDDYRAIAIPQVVEAGRQLISITLDGQTYSHTLTTPMKYQGGKLHNFTITVNKSAVTGDYEIALNDDGITPWVNDEESHQFSAKAFVTVHCPEYGKLREYITAAGYDYQTIKNLKVTGELTGNDFALLSGEMPELRHLNLKDVVIRNVRLNADWDEELIVADDKIPNNAFYGNHTIQSIVLPSKLKRIGYSAFREFNLVNSTIEIPEGVTDIEDCAFLYTADNNVELIFPSTIENIGGSAFDYCGYKCELKLTDNIRTIGGSAFSDTPNFYGVFHIPSKLKWLSGSMFNRMGSNGSFTGDVVIPQGITEIGDGEMNGDEHTLGVSLRNRVPLVLPEGLKRIGIKAFGFPVSSLHLNSDLVEIGLGGLERLDLYQPLELPASLQTVGSGGLGGAMIEGELVIPENCLNIGESAFSGQSLTKITLPSKLESIPKHAFSNLGYVKEIIIPKYVEYIEYDAFAANPYLQTVISLNPEPPYMDGDAFPDVYKDKCVLQVPEASIEAYRHADGWKSFLNITAYHELAYNVPEVLCLDKGITREGILRSEGAWEVSECPDWVTVTPVSGTDEEKRFEVSLTVHPLPAGQPDREGRIVFRLKDKNYTTYTTVRQRGGEVREDQSFVLQKASAGAPREIPIFIVGEGYNADDILSGEYLDDMRQQMEYLFSIEPYKTYRPYFTVSTAIACSPEHGTSGLTRFGGDDETVWQYALAHGTGISNERMAQATVLVLRNNPNTDNDTHITDQGRTICYMGKSQDSYPYDQRGFVLHELGGIAFGKLAPEYVRHFTFMKTCPVPECNDWGKYYWGKERGYYENITASGKMSDAPWAHLIFDPRYAQQVDMWEGGWRHARGMYRSEAQSVMSTYIPYYNTISRQSIVKRIMDYSGETFNLEKFFEKDKMEIPED
jgi:hypothetical protein